MKRLLAFALALASFGIVASTAEAKAAGAAVSAGVISSANAPAPQWQNNRGRRNRNRWGSRWNHRGGVHVTTQTRLVRFGRRLFRETYQVRILPNGRTQTTLISRVRVR
jgi:hypothetical protein